MKFFRFANRWFGELPACLLAAMSLAVIGEIMIREVICPLAGNPAWASSFSAPMNTVTQALLVWLGILGASVALRNNAHPGIDLLLRLYPPGVRKWAGITSVLLVAAFSAVVMIHGGYLVCSRAIRTNSLMPGFNSVNRAWFYSVLVIGGVANLIYCVRALWNWNKPAPPMIDPLPRSSIPGAK